jgi:hypothetical protein
MKTAAICVSMMLVTATAFAADAKVGHAHARRASTLAAAGKCKQAIPEFTAAYQALHDPALLFNRAECLRKTGRGHQAVGDYRKFLEEMPEAPNRETVESRIAALDPAAVPPPRPRAAVETPATASAPEPVIDAPKLAVVAPVAPASLHSASLRVAQALPPAPAPEREELPAIVARPAPAAVDHSERSAWIWMSVATAVVAAAAVSAALIASKPRNP